MGVLSVVGAALDAGAKLLRLRRHERTHPGLATVNIAPGVALINGVEVPVVDLPSPEVDEAIDVDLDVLQVDLLRRRLERGGVRTDHLDDATLARLTRGEQAGAGVLEQVYLEAMRREGKL